MYWYITKYCMIHTLGFCSVQDSLSWLLCKLMAKEAILFFTNLAQVETITKL